VSEQHQRQLTLIPEACALARDLTLVRVDSSVNVALDRFVQLSLQARWLGALLRECPPFRFALRLLPGVAFAFLPFDRVALVPGFFFVAMPRSPVFFFGPQSRLSVSSAGVVTEQSRNF
jgi:hypothetical protein